MRLGRGRLSVDVSRRAWKLSNNPESSRGMKVYALLEVTVVLYVRGSSTCPFVFLAAGRTASKYRLGKHLSERFKLREERRVWFVSSKRCFDWGWGSCSSRTPWARRAAETTWTMRFRTTPFPFRSPFRRVRPSGGFWLPRPFRSTLSAPLPPTVCPKVESGLTSEGTLRARGRWKDQGTLEGSSQE